MKQRHKELQGRAPGDADADFDEGASSLQVDTPKYNVVKNPGKLSFHWQFFNDFSDILSLYTLDDSTTWTLLGPGEERIESWSFTIKAPQSEEDNIENIRAVAEEFLDKAMETIAKHSEQLHDFQLGHLEDMYER